MFLCLGYNIFVWFCFTKKIWNIICHNLSISTTFWLWFHRCYKHGEVTLEHIYFSTETITLLRSIFVSHWIIMMSPFAINELTVYCHTVSFTVFFEGSSEGHALRHSYFLETRILSRPGFMAARWCKNEVVTYIFLTSSYFCKLQ